ncbi:MAG: GAF domain-containing protein [Anaerolineae bacterium]|nr:GAF domain-containing protein [Anaerolineae bacterium]MDW8173673.1 GAF domain-containing protein [Anaerolineae bacterium]
MSFSSPRIHGQDTDVLERLRSHFLRAYLAIAIVVSTVQGIVSWVIDGSFRPQNYLIALFAILMFYLAQRGRFVGFISNVAFALPILGIVLTSSAPLIIALTIVSSIVLPLFTNAVVYVLASVVILFSALRFDLTTPGDFSLTLIVGTSLAMSTMIYGFTRDLKAITRDSQRSAELLSAAAAIGQMMAQYLDLKSLLERTVDVIRDRLGYYHVQVFLVNEATGYAELVASTGEAGRQLLEKGHKLAISSNSIIGRVVQATEPIISREANRDEGHAFNEFLPNTRSELALPLIDGERIIGALDIQSLRADAFTRIDIQALQVIANQLATTIRNVRLFEAQVQSVNENKRLFVEAETNLREIQRLNRQLTRQIWENYTARTAAASGVTLDSQRFRPGGEWSARMIQACQRRRPVQQSQDDKRIIAVPIELRNEVIGAIEIEVRSDAPAQDITDMLQAIANRLAINIDNARLFEETQEATAQEQRISEIVSGYQSAQSVKELLEITLQGLAEAIGAEEGSIRLGTLPSPQDEPRITRTMPALPKDSASSARHNNNGGSHGD